MAGCLGEDGEISATASAAVIPEGQRQGYEADGPEQIQINETIEVSGLSRDVSINSWSVAYAAPEDQTSLFLFSTPDVKALGISVNPLARLSGADLIVRLLNEGLGRADGDMAVEEVEQETEVTVPVLGEDRTVPVFSATLETGSSGSDGGIAGGQNGTVDIRLYVLSITHEEDVLLSVGFHPEAMSASEDITSLLESIEHPVEVDAESTTIE